MRHFLEATLPASLAVLTLAMGMAPPRVSRRSVLLSSPRQARPPRRRRAPGRAVHVSPVAPPAQQELVAAPTALPDPELVHAVASATAGVDCDTDCESQDLQADRRVHTVDPLGSPEHHLRAVVFWRRCRLRLYDGRGQVSKKLDRPPDPAHPRARHDRDPAHLDDRFHYELLGSASPLICRTCAGLDELWSGVRTGQGSGDGVSRPTGVADGS